jgi:hypothetical protein
MDMRKMFMRITADECLRVLTIHIDDPECGEKEFKLHLQNEAYCQKNPKEILGILKEDEENYRYNYPKILDLFVNQLETIVALDDLIAKLTDKEKITPEDLASIENPEKVLVALKEISYFFSKVTIEEEGAMPNQQSTNTDAATENMFKKLNAIISGLEEVVEQKALEMADVATSLQQVTERLATAVQNPTATQPGLIATGLQQVTERLATAVQDQTATLAGLVAQVANRGRTSH